MLMGAVTGVDDWNFEMTGDEIGGAGGGVAHDEAVWLHGVEIVGGVEQGLAFFEAGSFGLKIHGIRAEARSSCGEAEACAGGIFEEGEGDCLAAKGGKFL